MERDATWELSTFLQACGCAVEREHEAWHVEPGSHPEPLAYHLMSDSTEIVTFIACAARMGVALRLTGITVDRTREAIAGDLVFLEEMGRVRLFWSDVRGSVNEREAPGAFLTA